MSPANAKEEQESCQEGARPGQFTHDSTHYNERGRGHDNSRTGNVTLGLLPAPGMPANIAQDLADELLELLNGYIDDSVSWDVSVITDPLTGDWRDAPEILDEVHDRKQREGWDYAICLTDLPVRREGQTIVADASVERGVGGISVPALGVTLLHRRVREATLQLVNEMYGPDLKSFEEDGEQSGDDAEAGTDDGSSGASSLRGRGTHQLIGNRLTERLAPIKRTTPTGEDMDIDVRFVSPRGAGRARLLAGMVLANRPWNIFLSMKSALAAAFAAGAYSLIFSTVWQLAATFGWPRFVALMLLSIVAMVVWIIVSHDLWERPRDLQSWHLAELYNAATALTLTVAVLISYAVLFVLILLAAWFFVPISLVQSTLGQQVGPGFVLLMAWLMASIATVAGALGSGLEDDETVLNATYGYRQRSRIEEYRQKRRQRHSAEGSEGGSATQ